VLPGKGMPNSADGFEQCGRRHGDPTDTATRGDVAAQLVQICFHRRLFRPV
jgi:hypothetical protein